MRILRSTILWRSVSVMPKFSCLDIKSAMHERQSLENNSNSNDPFLPDEIITEILSWLSVEELMRFKCVCKSWCATIEERNFIEKQKSRGKTVVEYGASNNGNENAYKWLFVQRGLVLESSNLLPNKYRIRNIATKQKLDLPKPLGQPLFFCISFLSTSNDYKVVCINHYNEGATSSTTSTGAGVLTIGTDDLTWRSLDIPTLHNMKSKREQRFLILIAQVCYFIALADYEIVCLEMETEKLKSVEIPKDWNNIRPLNWRGKLALASVVGEKMNIWVLESYKKQKWDNIKVVFPLDSIVKDPSIVLNPFKTEGNLLWINANNERQIAYNMRTNKFSTSASAPPTQKIMYVYQPSLVHFTGMTPVEN